jgi:hypothetical protein
MLKIVEYGLMAVSLLIVLALVVVSPRRPRSASTEAGDSELQPKLPPVVNR